LFFHDVPVYRGGVSLTLSGDPGVIESVVVALPRETPSPAEWGDASVAEATLRKQWGLDDVDATWLLRRGRKMWYSPSLVYGSVDADSWQPTWMFSSGGSVENPFDVVVSGDGTAVVDTIVVGGGTSLAPIPRYHVRPEPGVPDFVT
jgi:hypothetical protein